MKPIVHIKHPIGIDDNLGTLSEELLYDRHVVQLIKQVLFTSPGERINRPDFGCGLRRMLFAPNSDVTASLLQVTVYQALETWLPTVLKVEKVEVEAKDETLKVDIRYLLKAKQTRKTLTLDLRL